MTQKEESIKIIDEYVQELIGDTSVQNQLNIALNNHTHENYVTRTEYDALKAQVDRMSELVGDTPVAIQINTALNR